TLAQQGEVGGERKVEENQEEKSVGEGTSAKKGKEKVAEKEKEKAAEKEKEKKKEKEKEKEKGRKGHGIRHDNSGDGLGWVGEIKVLGTNRYIGKSRDKMELAYLHSIAYIVYDGYVSKVLMAELTGLEETELEKWWKSDTLRPSVDDDVGATNVRPVSCDCMTGVWKQDGDPSARLQVDRHQRTGETKLRDRLGAQPLDAHARLLGLRRCSSQFEHHEGIAEGPDDWRHDLVQGSDDGFGVGITVARAKKAHCIHGLQHAAHLHVMYTLRRAFEEGVAVDEFRLGDPVAKTTGVIGGDGVPEAPSVPHGLCLPPRLHHVELVTSLVERLWGFRGFLIPFLGFGPRTGRIRGATLIRRLLVPRRRCRRHPLSIFSIAERSLSYFSVSLRDMLWYLVSKTTEISCSTRQKGENCLEYTRNRSTPTLATVYLWLNEGWVSAFVDRFDVDLLNPFCPVLKEGTPADLRTLDIRVPRGADKLHHEVLGDDAAHHLEGPPEVHGGFVDVAPFGSTRFRLHVGK
ncbi:unnamed protein product, partial [Closterium sp. NIES-54]